MRKSYLAVCALMLLFSCNKVAEIKTENAFFNEVGSIDIGDVGAAEISAFDPLTKKLFVVNNGTGGNRIDVIQLGNLASPVLMGSISVTKYGGFVNSVAVSNGKLAAAIEAADKVNPGKVVVFNTATEVEIANVTVGSLPDMVTFTPDGKFILSANEGEPNDAYTIDPVGTVSIISINENYAVTTLDFSSLASQEAALKAKGFRIFGKNASFIKDIEPEYIAISANSNTAWVTLQENNGIAQIDIKSKTITGIYPLGFKDYNNAENSIDPSDQDGGVTFGSWPVKGIYMPDGITVMDNNGTPFLFTANEGDAREYTGYAEIKRISSSSVILDPVKFPNAVTLKTNAQLGRLNITTSLGNTDADAEQEELYSLGARSFSIWNGKTGELVFDSKNEIDKKAFEMGKYPDGRSDDKGCEPEGITIGRVGNKNILFVGLERANAVLVYDVTNPVKPTFIQWLNCGEAPEGVLFVSADKSPNGKSLLIVSSENDGVIKIFSTL